MVFRPALKRNNDFVHRRVLVLNSLICLWTSFAFATNVRLTSDTQMIVLGFLLCLITCLLGVAFVWRRRRVSVRSVDFGQQPVCMVNPLLPVADCLLPSATGPPEGRQRHAIVCTPSIRDLCLLMKFSAVQSLWPLALSFSAALAD